MIILKTFETLGASKKIILLSRIKKKISSLEKRITVLSDRRDEHKKFFDTIIGSISDVEKKIYDDRLRKL